MPLHVSSTCAHHQEVKIALHSLWYHHTYRWPSRAQVNPRILGFHFMTLRKLGVSAEPVHETATYRSDCTRGCVMQF